MLPVDYIIKVLDEYHCRIQLFKILVAFESLATVFDVWCAMATSAALNFVCIDGIGTYGNEVRYYSQILEVHYWRK